MKKKALMIFTFLMLFFMGNISAFAGNSGYSWYCAHKKGNKQPPVSSELSFVEELGAFYIDKNHGDESADKVLYLTFDVGYENGNVARILDTLKSENVSGAFFVLGNVIERNTDLVNRMFDEGHLVCNHTYSHKSIVGKSCEEIGNEIQKLEKSCFEKTGKNLSKYFRPPEGRFDETSLQYIRELGYTTVFWSFGYDDWDNNRQMSAEKAKNKILENVHNGEIMLLHPTSKTNADILGDVIKELKKQGYRFGTLDELCEKM